MKIYKVSPKDRFSSIEAKNKFDREKISQFYTTRLTNNWKVIKVDFLKSIYRGDFLGINGGTVIGISNKVKKILNSQSEGIEFLPLKHKKTNDFFALNVLNFITILDENKSELVKLKENKIIMIDKYIFKQNLGNLPLVFKLVNYEKGSIFATDEFKEIIENNNLTGLQFEEVWHQE